jgi:hypothetical protein
MRSFLMFSILVLAGVAHADPRRSLSTFQEMLPGLNQLINENQELVVGGTGPLTKAQVNTLRRNAKAFTRQVAIGGSILSSITFDGVDGESIKASWDKGVKPRLRKMKAANDRLSRSLSGRRLVTRKDAQALVGEIRLIKVEFSFLVGRCAKLKRTL